MPDALQVVADPHRWRLLRELAHSDRRVSELTSLLGAPQNLVSYHLRELRDAGLVSARRSSFDGRDTYYRVDLNRCGELLCAAGAALDPGLRLEPSRPLAAHRRRRRPRVLFLCTGNSARSQMAEALLEHRSGHAIEARSAGSHPKALHPNAVRVMAERGIDISAPHDQAARPVLPHPLRPRHHAVRQGPGGLPRVPRPAGDRALEHRRPVRGGRHRRGELPGVRADADELEVRIGHLIARPMSTPRRRNRP